MVEKEAGLNKRKRKLKVRAGKEWTISDTVNIGYTCHRTDCSK
jgi:hypothetical protein